MQEECKNGLQRFYEEGVKKELRVQLLFYESWTCVTEDEIRTLCLLNVKCTHPIHVRHKENSHWLTRTLHKEQCVGSSGEAADCTLCSSPDGGLQVAKTQGLVCPFWATVLLL